MTTDREIDREIESARATLAEAVGELGKILSAAKSLLDADRPEAVPAIVFGYKALEMLLSTTIDLAIAGAFEAKDDSALWRIYDRNLRREFDLARLRAEHVDDVAYTERPCAKDFESHFCAIRTAQWCAEDLGIPMPRIRWFSERAGSADALNFKGSPGLRGKFERVEPEVVWLHSGLSPRDVINTVAHELFHAAQHARGERDEHFEGVLEPAAYTYGKHVALRLYGPTGYGQAYTWRAQAREAMARNRS